MDSNPSTLHEPTGGESGVEYTCDGILPSSTNQQPQQHVESVTEPPSLINLPRTEDMSCTSSVTTHFRDAELFVPHMYPSAQNLRDSDDVENPTFLPAAQQAKQTTNQPVLPPLPAESSQDPTDSKRITASHQKKDENRILKVQEKATMKEASSNVPSMASLESRLNQKNQIYSVRQISFESNGDTGIDPIIREEQIEDEVATKIANDDDAQGTKKVLRLGQNKDPGIRNPAIDVGISTVNEDNTAIPLPTWLQELPGPQDFPGPRDHPPSGNTASVPGAHSVSTPFGTFSQRQANPSTRGENQNTAVDEEEGREDSPAQTLAEARPVVEDDLPVAMADSGNERRYQGSNWPFYIMAGIFCILVVAAVVIGATCGTGHCSHKVYVDGSSTMAPTTTRDAVVAPKIETVLTSLLGKDYFKQVEEGDDSDTTEFMLESRQKAFDWIVNQDPLQLEYASPNLVQRFLLVLFYYQTTRHEPWKECNPPSTFQGGTPSDFCYKLDHVTGETTSDIWGDQWLTKSHECQWAGMICETVQTKAKTVVGVSVRWNRLNGPLPWEIAQLPHLKQLHLNDNMLSGMLPPKLLSYSLERLQLGNNQLSGHIPAIWFENLHDGNAKLTSLQIDKNWLTGTIPSEMGLFPMEVVYLHRNQLSGSLPVELSAHTSLKILLLGYNDLTGTVPSEFGLLTSLKGNLYLGHTHISGTLPSEIALLSTLQDIDLSSTNMQGTLPQEMYTGLTDLRAFSGNNCNFSGTISSSLGLLTSLVWLRLANNNFHGTIPSEIEELTSLMHLVVNGNQLTGTVPASLCLSAAFVEIYGAALVADCLPNQETGLPTIVCAADCCTSCCDNTGVCLGN